MTEITAVQRTSDARSLDKADFSCSKTIGAMTQAELYSIIDRRVSDEVQAQFRHMDKKMDDGLREIRNLLTSAFPAGNPEEHRRYHEEIMAYMSEKRALWRDIRTKTLTGLVWAGLIALGSSVWHYIKVKLGAP